MELKVKYSGRFVQNVIEMRRFLAPCNPQLTNFQA